MSLDPSSPRDSAAVSRRHAVIDACAVVLLVPAARDEPRRPNYDPEFHRALRASPSETLADVRRRFQSLDGRLARLERYVTSSRFDLDQEFRKL